MPKITSIRVSFSRQANDGNYGSETARYEVELIPTDEIEVLDGLHATQALAACRSVVHAELARSPNWSVRRAVEEAKPLGEPDPGEHPQRGPDREFAASGAEDIPF